MEDLMWIGSRHCYRSHQIQSLDARAAIAKPELVYPEGTASTST
jgi:hypothetical protein